MNLQLEARTLDEVTTTIETPSAAQLEREVRDIANDLEVARRAYESALLYLGRRVFHSGGHLSPRALDLIEEIKPLHLEWIHLSDRHIEAFDRWQAAEREEA